MPLRAARPAKGALRDKSWQATIFKISAQRFNVYICNVLIIYSEKVRAVSNGN